jgi:hypothetical protein
MTMAVAAMRPKQMTVGFTTNRSGSQSPTDLAHREVLVRRVTQLWVSIRLGETWHCC